MSDRKGMWAVFALLAGSAAFGDDWTTESRWPTEIPARLYQLPFGALPVIAGEGQDATPETGRIPVKSLALLSEEKLAEIDHVEIKGKNPKLIYIPILHDNPEHRHAGTDSRQVIEENLGRCRKIAEHLHVSYGVRNVLLEGIAKTLSDKYNSPQYRGRKLSVGESKSIIFKVWFDLLNAHPWQLVPAYEKNIFGPLTLLGSEYTGRIQKALDKATEKGWFRSGEAFTANRVEFDRLIEEAAGGYNERRKAILKEDPGLKREYGITVLQRNKEFIDNSLAVEGPGIILCGGGHVQDLIRQFEERGLSYMIVVPKGISWPPAKKDEGDIYREMLALGCQLKNCSITLGDGKGINVLIPVDTEPVGR
jgi:hypothetical protein